MSKQLFLIPLENFSKDRLRKFEVLFSYLPVPPKIHQLGRTPFSIKSILNALIYKNLTGILIISDLVRHLFNHPTVAEICGFDPLKFPPSIERFSSFIKDTPNSFFTNIRENLIIQLINLGEISGEYISTDSCPIKANVKQNNLKTNVKDRFDKFKIPKGDPDCRLGIIVTFPSNKKEISFFWGYRNHVIIDTLSGLCVAEKTYPANVSETSVIIPQLNYIKNTFNFQIKAVIADSLLDSISIIQFIAETLKAEPIIARNPRSAKRSIIQLSKKGIPICKAGFEMVSRGKYFEKDKNRTRHKFICPIRGSKKFAKQNPFCTWNLPIFLKGSGCYVNLRVDVDDSYRKAIDYNSQTFKKLYNLHSGSERTFSRLSSIFMQDPTVKGLNATANICTIAHITSLLVALTAVKTGHKDKIRFIKSFIPSFNPNQSD